MTYRPLTAALLATAFVAGCQLTPQQRQVASTVGGLGAGLLVASAFDANTELTILAAAAGAAAGTLLAQETSTGNCAYANGDGTYSVAPCP
ncbi:MAG: glucose-6-phosphate isomerase [Pseudomonadota bacterium]